MNRTARSGISNRQRAANAGRAVTDNPVALRRLVRFGMSLALLLVLVATWRYLRLPSSSVTSQGDSQLPKAVAASPASDLAKADDRMLSSDVLLKVIESLKNEATQIARLLTAKFPNDAYCHDLLAGVQYRLAGETAKADELWQKSIQLDRKFLPPYFGRASIAWSQGDIETAIQLMQQVLQQDPNSADAQIYLANALIESGRFEEAVKTVEATNSSAPMSVANCLLLGKAYMQLDEFSKAVQYYERAVQLNTNCWEAYYGLAQANQRLGHAEEARQQLAKFKSLQGASDQSTSVRSIELDADFVRQEVVGVCLAAGEICNRHGEFDAAERYLLRAAALDPRDPRSRQALQQLYEQQHRTNHTAGAPARPRSF
jgi:tetratricopeptide (TPR) repeat protein